MLNTSKQYDNIISKCTEIFKNKTLDYGTAWRILRSSSLTDQIFIKANRIRTIQETGSSKVNEGVESEFIGIINYCIMALIQLDMKEDDRMEIPSDEVITLYNSKIILSKTLMEQKNHDYGEAWRDMRVSSLTDLILMKVLRVKQIEDNMGKTLISEGIDANYYDMINYSVFAMIHLT
jgi:hypothetical protein